MSDNAPDSDLNPPISVKAISSIILAAYANGAEAKLNPSTVEKQLQEAIGPELLTGDGHWPGHATILLALGNPYIAETRMTLNAWDGACQVVADYMIQRFLPKATAHDGRYAHHELGEFTLSELALLPAIVAGRKDEMYAALDTHVPNWRSGIDQLWQSSPERAFHTNSSHVIAEDRRSHFIDWMASSLSLAARMSDEEIMDHITTLAMLAHTETATTPLLFTHLRNSGVRLMTPIPEEVHDLYGKTVASLLDTLAKEPGTEENVQKIRAALLSARLERGNSRADAAIPVM